MHDATKKKKTKQNEKYNKKKVQFKKDGIWHNGRLVAEKEWKQVGGKKWEQETNLTLYLIFFSFLKFLNRKRSLLCILFFFSLLKMGTGNERYSVFDFFSFLKFYVETNATLYLKSTAGQGKKTKKTSFYKTIHIT